MRKFYLTLLLLLAVGNESMALSVSHLKVNAVTNPYGLDTNPTFSWILESDKRGCVQKSYKILIWQDGEDNILFDSGFIESKESVNVLLDGLNLTPSTCYNWAVTVRDNNGFEATSSERSSFVTGLLNTGWDGAQWIAAKSHVGSMPRFRKQFSLSKPIKNAILYSSALGVYDVYINGNRVGKVDNNGTTIYNELKPGWTDYRKTVNYNTFDVTPYLKEGVNVIGSLVANGWWKGRISVGFYGDHELAFLAKMVVFYDDNSKEIFITDKTWQSNTTGPLLIGDIWDGEEYDATKEDNWMESDSDLTQWQNVGSSNAFTGQIKSILGADVISQNKYIQKAKSVTIYEGIVNTGTDYGIIDKKELLLDKSFFSLKKGQTAIIDFGQNIVGRTPFTIIAAQFNSSVDGHSVALSKYSTQTIQIS